VVIFYFLCIDTFELAYAISLLFLKDYYFDIGFKVYPLINWMAGYMFVYKVCVILPFIFNYFVFYFMVRDSYKVKKEAFETTLDTSDLDIAGQHSNKEIDLFLS
jgi:hypothetical protein